MQTILLQKQKRASQEADAGDDALFSKLLRGLEDVRAGRFKL